MINQVVHKVLKGMEPITEYFFTNSQTQLGRPYAGYNFSEGI